MDKETEGHEETMTILLPMGRGPKCVLGPFRSSYENRLIPPGTDSEGQALNTQAGGWRARRNEY